MTVVALIVVPGSIDRSGPSAGAVSPVWADVHGRPLLRHAVDRLRDAGVHRVVLAVEAADADRTRALFADEVVVTTSRGGEVEIALSRFTDAKGVLLHDPRRALAPVAMIRRVLDGLGSGAVAVVPVLPVVDTMRSVGADGRASAVVDREALRIVQSPQGFDLDVLRRAHAGSPAAVDAASLVVAAGFPLTTVAGHADAGRVLTAADLDHARRVLGPTSPTLDVREPIDG